MISSLYRNKKILITGHTGFKGTWLTTWLLKLGAKICGISDRVPTQPSMFETLGLDRKIEHHFCDIRNQKDVDRIIISFRPDFIFHLAAQAIVSQSYEEPIETITTNVLGTAVILDVLRKIEHDCTAIIITSDKCYENVEWEWGYKEIDHLGGKDIYSGSKGAAEIIFHAYFHSFLKHKKNLKVASARAGNVIGGGDWANDRIVADCVRNWSKGVPVNIRSPKSTRPWQHVLEPLSGYLTLGVASHARPELNGESFNFGPKSEQNRHVLELLSDLSKYWKFESIDDAYRVTGNTPFHEAALLKLNCDKALFHLKWEPNLHFDECVRFVSEWYYKFYKEDIDMFEFTIKQIEEYTQKACERGMVWTRV
jgi:CDP-glucose 4,6-dehydratase